MNKQLRRLYVPLLLLAGIPLCGMERESGWCERGGQVITVIGYQSSTATPVQRSYPTCLVTVYLTGTLTKATIYSDNSGTSLANPFTSSTTGAWFFYAQNGRYDVSFSGSDIGAPFAMGDVLLADGFHIPGVFDDSDPNIPDFIAVDATVGTNVNADIMHQQLSNYAGHRPLATSGAMIIPATSTTSEAAGAGSVVYNASEMTNGVALSGFISSNANAPGGTVNTSGTAVTLVSGSAFKAGWCVSNNAININNLDYNIASCTDASHLVLSGSAGTQTGVPYIKYIDDWSMNILCENGLPGLGTSYSGHRCLNELDFNNFDATGRILALSFGGNGSVQPAQAIGIDCNGLGPGLLWDNCYGGQDGTARVFMTIPVANIGNGYGSEPIIIYSRNLAGDASSTAIRNDANGNLQMAVGFSGPMGANPEFVFNDAEGNIVIGVEGAVGLPYPVLAMGNKGSTGDGGRMQTGLTHFANLNTGPFGGGMFVYCTDCKNVVNNSIVAGSACVGGGNGAQATYEGGHWACF